uniref:Uncharacterized protein n=1 Tax=Clytia hemisphaerica TaxID=252671 RepID=A0A7M5TRU1_9CNID
DDSSIILVDLEHQKAELLEQIEEMNRDTKVLHSKYNDLYKEKVRLDELITSLKLKNKKQKREFKEWRSAYGKEMCRQMARMEAELVGITKENDVLREAVHCLTGEAQAKDVMIEELLAEEMASVVIPSEEKDMDIKLKEEKFEINSNPSETKLLFVMGDVKALLAYNFDGTLKENDLIVDKADVPDEPVSTIATKKTDLINDGIEKTVVMKAGAAESSAETLAMLYETGCHQEIKQKRKNKKQKRRRRRKQ